MTPLTEPIKRWLLPERVQITALAKLPDQERIVIVLDRAPLIAEPSEL